MANSKFSGVGFASGQNSNSNSVLVGYESGQNRRWTLAELAAGLPGSTLQQVMNAGSVSTVTSQTTTIRVDSSAGNYSQLTFGGATPGDRATMQTELAGGGGSSFGASIFGTLMSWSTFGVGTKTIEVGPNFMKVDDAVSSKGLEYDADYSANFTTRSLVDKGYVDGLVGTTPTLQDIVNTGNVIRNVSGDTNIIKINDGNVLQSIELGGTGTTFGIEGVPGTNVNITTAAGQSVTLGDTTSNRRLNIFNDFGGFTDAIFESNCNAWFKASIKDGAGNEGTDNTALMFNKTSGGGYLADTVRWKNPNGELILLPDTPDQDIYNDGNIYIKLNDAGTDDIQAQVLTEAAGGASITFTWESNGGVATSGGNSLNILSGMTTLNGDFGAYDMMRMTVYAPTDTTYPYYEFVFTKGADGTNFVTRVTKWDSIS